MKEKICCFTGHRPQNLSFGFNEEDKKCSKLKKLLKKEIKTLIKKEGVTCFITGMALGVDTYVAEIILELKSKYDIKLECAIPCRTQSVKWSRKFQDRYNSILQNADEVNVLQETYTSGCMQRRNEYMVNKSDYIIAVWDESPSGTGSTVRYAEERNKKIIVINPDEL